MKFSSSFSQLRILLFGLVICFSSCEVLPLLQREYKPITRSKTTIYSYNEFSVIPAGPMDTEESVFGSTTETGTDVAVNGVEAQKKMIENKMNKARTEAIKKANEKTSNNNQVKVVSKDTKQTKRTTTKKSEPEIRIIDKREAKITTVSTKERQAEKKASNVVAEKEKKVADKVVIDNQKAKAIAKKAKAKKTTPTPITTKKVEKPVVKVEKVVTNKSKKEKQKKVEKSTTAKVAKSTTKKATAKNVPKAYNVETSKSITKKKEVAVKKSKKAKAEKEAAIVAMNKEGVTEKGGNNLKSLLRKRKNLKAQGEKIPSKAEIAAKKEKAAKKETIVAKKESPKQGKEISVKDIKIESPVMAATPKVQPKLKPFFYPIESLTEAKAYQFCTEGYEKDTTYHLMKTLVYGGSTILITEIYNKNFEIQKITRESITDKGVFLRDYTSYEVDGLGEVNQIDCGVDADESLSWTLGQGEQNKLTLNYHSSLYPNFNITKERQRALVKESETVQYAGKDLKAIILKDSEITTFTDHKDVQEEKESFTFTHKFAEGVGLIEYEVRQSGRSTKKYELNEILSYEEWSSLSRLRKPSKGN